MLQNRNVETAEVKELQDLRISDQGCQARCHDRAARDLDEMGVAVAGRELDQAKPVAMRIETHRFGIDGHDRPERQFGG